MGRKLNVLLVDDSLTMIEHLEQILCEVEDIAIVGVAFNGAEAIRMTGDSRPDLVLLDILMPGLGGLSALRTIRSMYPRVYVVMVSWLGGDPTRAQEAIKLGAYAVVEKPASPEVIESVVEDVRSGLRNDSAVP